MLGFPRKVFRRAVKSVCMRGGPGWDLARARGRLRGVQSIGVGGCSEPRFSDVGITEARITLRTG